MNSENRRTSLEVARIGLSFVSMAVLIGVGWGADEKAPLVARPLGPPPAVAEPEPAPAPEPEFHTAVAAVPFPVPAEEIPVPLEAPLNFSSGSPLKNFLAEDESIVLKNATDFRQVQIPVPWRAKWPEMRFEIRYQNSGALIPQRSQLELWWAGGMVSQAPLDGRQAEGGLLALIPNRHLRPGRHSLELRALHQTAEKCGDPFGEELWTQIDPSESTVTLNYQLRSLSPVLSDLPRLFDRHGWEPCRLRLVTAESWALTGIHLEWMSRVTQRVALLLESVPLDITHASALDATGDHIVVGLRQEILPLLPDSIAAEVTDSFIGIFPHPRDDRFFLTVVAGSSREGIEKAVRAFSATEFNLPPDRVLDLTAVALPEAPPAPPSPVLRSGEERSFDQLGGRTWELQGLTSGKAGIPIHFPPGVDFAKSTNLKLKLRMAWSPVRRDATVDIFVNGSREVTIPIGKSDSTRFDDYQMDLPLRSFRPGINRIAFRPNLIPPNAGECKPVNWDSLRFVLEGNSRVNFPEVDREIRLPNLELTARSAVPAANLDSGAERQRFTVFMSERESDHLSAGCTLLGKFTQTAGKRLPWASLSFEEPPAESHYVALGPENSLPAALVPGGANFKIKGGDHALAAQFESPLNSERIGMIVTTTGNTGIAEPVRELVIGGLWDQLSGDTVSWGREADLLTVRPGQFSSVTVYHDAESKQSKGSGFSRGWILYPLAFLLLAGGGVTLYFRKEQRRNHLPGRVSIDAPLLSLGSEDRI